MKAGSNWPTTAYLPGAMAPDGTASLGSVAGAADRGGAGAAPGWWCWKPTGSAGLGEKEYAFGNMLREFFARVPHVEVRQRFFTNEEGLAKWCRELLYLPEPIALVFATHGTPEGLTAGGELIRRRAARGGAASRRQHPGAAFLVVSADGSGPAGNFARVLREKLPFPISGYTTSVDWAASALIEFTYLDMILARGLNPQAAAEQVTRLLTFAGERGRPIRPIRRRTSASGRR